MDLNGRTITRTSYDYGYNTEEMLTLAKREGYKLSEAEMEAVSGGWDSCEGFTECALRGIQ